MFIREGKIFEDLAGKICDWPHSGFNIHNEVEIKANDDIGMFFAEFAEHGEN